MKKIIIILNLIIVSLAAIAGNTTVHVRFKMLRSNTVEVLLPVGDKTFFLIKKHTLLMRIAVLIYRYNWIKRWPYVVKGIVLLLNRAQHL